MNKISRQELNARQLNAMLVISEWAKIIHFFKGKKDETEIIREYLALEKTKTFLTTTRTDNEIIRDFQSFIEAY